MFVAYEKLGNVEEIIKGFKIEEIDLRAKYLEGKPKEVLSRIESERQSRN